MVDITVPARVIIALLPHAADKKDPRTYLRGVRVCWGPQRLAMIATDGQTMLAYALGEGEEFKPFTIPSEALKFISLRGGNVEILSHEEEGITTITLRQGAAQHSTESIGGEGQYPRWQAVVPSTVSGDPAQYSDISLMKLAGSGRVLRGAKRNTDGYKTIYYNGIRPAVVDLGDDNAVALVQPNNQHEVTSPFIPFWARQ